MQILDASVESDRSVWLDAWRRSPMRLPFAHPGFVELVAPEGGSAHAALFDGRALTVLHPFVLRPLASGGCDLTSPYGYGGPIHWGPGDVDRVAPKFWAEFDGWARQAGVVTEFIRMSLFDDVLPYPGRLRERALNYVRTLDPRAADVWAGTEPKVRQNGRRAIRSGVAVGADTTGRMLDDFVRIYTATMERRHSDEWYRFGRPFFERLHRELPGRYVYVYARRGDVTVSMDLVLLGGDTGYYFLGGTDADSFGCRPNDLVKLTVMEWLRERGYRRYVLGGGVRPGDGLERYKRGFAPDGAHAFRTGERILDRSAYDALMRRRFGSVAEAQGGDFFPAYRAPLAGDAGVRGPDPEPAAKARRPV